jgi:hypothetical protein
VLTKFFRVFSEGSLLKRTLLHVGVLVVMSGAFIAITSFALVSIAKGVVPATWNNGGTAVAASTAEAASGAADDEGDNAPPPGVIRPRLGGARHMKKRAGVPINE